MRNQAFLLAACAAVVIGCGGGGGRGVKRPGTTTGGTTGGLPSASVGFGVDLRFRDNGGAVVNSQDGRVEVSYLTGTGRASGDTFLEIVRQTIQNGPNQDVFSRSDGSGPLELNLAGFQTLKTSINVPFGGTTGRVNSQLETQIVFDPSRILVEDDFGNRVEIPNGLPSNLPAIFPARIRAFPNRSSLVQIKTGDGVIRQETGGVYTFDDALFRSLNFSTTGTDPTAINTIPSRLNDFFRFPLTGLALADRPYIQSTFDPADESDESRPRAGFVYSSGDNYALSNETPGPSSVFQEITNDLNEYALGRWGAASGRFQGTYLLLDQAPLDVNGEMTRLVSTYGDFRRYDEVLTGGGTFEMVMLPNSAEKYDSEQQGQVIAIARNGAGTVTNAYFGGVNLEDGTFEMFPIFYLGVSPAFPGSATKPSVAQARMFGTVSGYSSANLASVRQFNFAFGNGSATPVGGVAQGTGTVLR